MTNVIDENKVVSLAYTLRLANGEIVDYSEAGEPLEYLHGAGNIIPGLETALGGLGVGAAKDVAIDPEDGYGAYDPEDVQTVPLTMIPRDVKLELGMELVVSDEQGNFMEAFVREIGPQHVVLDFNHPLAGQKLFFSVEVVDVREATPEEIEHGHPHSMFGEDDLEDDFEDDEDDEYYEDDEDDEDFEEDEEDPKGGNPHLRFN
jgi:FKBP-type peptidyl-prolyl cis-trans isomerase SlyD